VNGHAMKFGHDAGPQIYHSFEVMFEDEDGVSLGKFGPTRQPFPSYAIGHRLHVDGEFLLITEVIHFVEPKSEPEDWLLRTTVIVRKSAV
jgi:hypothetical protein